MVRQFLESLQVYLDRRVITILLLGFSSGLPLALTGTTLSLWLREEGITLTSIGLFANVATPYALKFIWSPLVDKMPIPLFSRFLGRRRGWLIFTQICLILSILGLGASNPNISIEMTALFAFLVAFSSASQDIVIDAYRVEISDEKTMAAGAAAIVFGYRIGMLASGAGALYLASSVSWQMTYSIMAGLIFIGILTVLFNREPEKAGAPEPQENMVGASALEKAGYWLKEAVYDPLAEFFKRPGWVPILLFVMLYKFGDSLAGVMSTPFFYDLGFTKIELANVSKIYGTAATFIGLALGGWLMAATGLYRTLWICGFLQLGSNLMFAGQAMAGNDIVFLAATVGIENLAGGMGTAAFVAYLSSLCNISYTATQYALLSSFMATARIWFSSPGGFLAEQTGWITFFILTTLAAVPGLVLLWWLTRKSSETRPEEARASAN
ncbi:MFS transporter [Sneathiella sp. P13V-1]|uniref:AmpG family muropeptide MFS transporter n=1 Tax=Sneathiella sp. P13V-1 TaxID=2697366 RepID=UPI00187B5D55|nr:AmpG family muropeptide MFS transporter [Sneathiella sp. P13V-1]MBE7635832.1 MFS transporter [Sneathiella sp. P13V-1]